MQRLKCRTPCEAPLALRAASGALGPLREKGPGLVGVPRASPSGATRLHKLFMRFELGFLRVCVQGLRKYMRPVVLRPSKAPHRHGPQISKLHGGCQTLEGSRAAPPINSL